MKKRIFPHLKKAGVLLHRAAAEWDKDKAQRLSAALAFYTLFSLAPLGMLVVYVAGMFFGRETARAYWVGKTEGLMGREAAGMISGLLDNMAEPVTSVIAGVLGIVMLLWGASTVFGCLADSLNTIWDAQRPSGRFGIRRFVTHKLLAFIMVVGTGAYLVFSSLLTAGIAAAGMFLKERFPMPLFVFQSADFIGSVVAMTALFAAVFKWVPFVRQSWRDVAPGALVTAVAFSIGKYLIGLYFVNSTLASAYGAAGSLVVMLIWIYFCAQIFFFGAEFNKVYMRTHGSGSRAPGA
jgi:membrane protein